ncbi:hypothetical protein [Salmonirosea aquatica]|uniref:Uncharacterized protein n=1 Tax=Salmonirosea aquatica TaxID=2654236 RepID=A0A7C9BNG0_9BACT|nr:hypothetical protein [Cytophagaceae bacterium SJW1-29]
MSKKTEWRVLADYDGQVTLEKEGTGVTLSNELPQTTLAELAQDGLAVGFMEKAAVNDTTDVKDKN